MLKSPTFERSNMISAVPRSTERRGAAAVELAITVGLVCWLLLGMWEIARMVEIQQIVGNAAREGARQASTGQVSDTQVIQVVKQYLQDAGIPAATAANANVTVTNLGFSGNPTPPDNNPVNATELDRLQITVSIPFESVRWISLYLVTNSSTTITGQTTFSCLKDLSYPDPTPLPGF